MFKSRKLVLFLITLAAVITLSFFSKDTAAVVTLYGAYCCGNVGAKFSSTMQRKEA